MTPTKNHPASQQHHLAVAGLGLALMLGASAAYAEHQVLSTFFLASDAQEISRELPQEVIGACSDPHAGDRGIGALATNWVARLVVEGVRERLDRELAQYSAVLRSRPVFQPFFDQSNWFYGDDGTHRTACIYFAVQDAPAADASPGGPALDAVFQMRANEHYVQIRPLAIRLRHQLTSKSTKGDTSIVIDLDAEAVWRSGTLGRKERIFRTRAIEAEVPPQHIGQWIPVAMHWESTPALPLPPMADDGQSVGVVGLTWQLAVASRPPRGLVALRRFVADNEGRLPGVLVAAWNRATKG